MHILIAGMMAADPYQGGATWAVLQYVLGFEQLGHQVTFIEPVPQASLRPVNVSLVDSDNAEYFRSVSTEFRLAGKAGLLDENSKQTFGITYEQMLQAASQADLLINISGMLQDEAILNRVRRRVFLDLDPAFNQLWHTQGIDMRLSAHTDFVTIGQSIGSSTCNIPTCGVDWITTWQPIVLDRWPAGAPIERSAFTTVGNWRAYGSITHDGTTYGQKAHSLRRFIELPRLTSAAVQLAIDVHHDEQRDIQALERNGWQLVNPLDVAGTPALYQRFIQGSLGELGIAKSGYVESQCGWFSDRSICYLASGRPVIAQDTGIRQLLPVGKGLLAFSDMKELLNALDEVRSNYDAQAIAAREIAESFFDSRKVLARLLQELGA